MLSETRLSIYRAADLPAALQAALRAAPGEILLIGLRYKPGNPCWRPAAVELVVLTTGHLSTAKEVNYVSANPPY